LLRGGKNMMGKKLFIPMENKTINVTVANPVFFDKKIRG
jgi:sarcosine oxidase subunit alpha